MTITDHAGPRMTATTEDFDNDTLRRWLTTRVELSVATDPRPRVGEP